MTVLVPPMKSPVPVASQEPETVITELSESLSPASSKPCIKRPPVPTKRLFPESTRVSPVPTVILCARREPESVTVSGLVPTCTIPRRTPVSSSRMRSPSSVRVPASNTVLYVAPFAMRRSSATFTFWLFWTNVPLESVNVPFTSIASWSVQVPLAPFRITPEKLLLLFVMFSEAVESKVTRFVEVKVPPVASHVPLTVTALAPMVKVPLMSMSSTVTVPPGWNVSPVHIRSSRLSAIVTAEVLAEEITPVMSLSPLLSATAICALVTAEEPDSDRTISLFWYRCIPVRAPPEPRTTVTPVAVPPLK